MIYYVGNRRLTMVCRCLAVVVVLCLAAYPALAFGPFHAPITEAEKTLAGIIAKVQDDGDLPHYLLQHASADPVREKQNNTMFTPALQKALLDAEADRVYTQCGGQYIKGQHCGIAYNPVTCLDFERKQYVFRTDSAGAFSKGDYSAVIAYKLPAGQQIIATYTMLKVDGKWKLDGIDCTVGGSFNM